MKLFLSFLVFVFCFCSCGQNEWSKSLYEQKYISEAMRLSQLENTDSTQKAIDILNILTKEDSNNIDGYYFKFTCQTQLKQFDSALITWGKILKFNPKNIFTLSQGGLLYYKLGDSVSSCNLFQESLAIGQKEASTMKVNNKNYIGLLFNNASDLIMLNKPDEANVIFKKLSELEKNNSLKNYFLLNEKLDKQAFVKSFALQNFFDKTAFN